MGRFILKRLLQNVPILIGITVISFAIIHLAPGSPLGMTLDPKVSPKIIEQMEKNYDLDKPLHVQYGLWLKKLFTGELCSFKDGRPVIQKIMERLPATILLNVVAMVIVFSVAIPMGVFSAARRYSLPDNIGTFLAYVGISMPSFWLAYLLILATVKLFGYPVLGIRSFGLGDIGWATASMDRLWHLMLPATVLATSSIAAISRYTRSSMLEVVEQDYIRTARAKGLAEDEVYYRHALRNALLPIATLFGFLVPSLIGGSVIIETVFAWPGIGRLAYQAVLARDYSVVMTVLTISSALTLLGNLISDVLYAVVDPRIRLG
ncbi:MAG: ABC transporter permease [Pseudomonadota bacterium]